MDTIADRARVSKNTIYRRWRSKEELIADALRELTAEAELTQQDDPYAALLETTRDIARVLAEPLVGRILPGLLGELQRNPAFATLYADRVVRPRRQAIIDALAKALERKELHPDSDPDQIADLLIGPLFLRLLFPFGLPDLTQHYPEHLLETLWNGIAPPESTTKTARAPTPNRSHSHSATGQPRRRR
jgi:AcrR family transcriptional regulator